MQRMMTLITFIFLQLTLVDKLDLSYSVQMKWLPCILSISEGIQQLWVLPWLKHSYDTCLPLRRSLLSFSSSDATFLPREHQKNTNLTQTRVITLNFSHGWLYSFYCLSQRRQACMKIGMCDSVLNSIMQGQNKGRMNQLLRNRRNFLKYSEI